MAGDMGSMVASLVPSIERYGVLSASSERSRARQNATQHKRLHSKLLALGYHPEETNGHWGLPAPAWLIPNIAFEDLVLLARHFKQESVIFCPDGQPRVLNISGISSPPPALD